MTPEDPENPDSARRGIARGWVLRLGSGDVDTGDLQALRKWRRKSVANNAAFEAERRLYRSLQPLDLAFAEDKGRLPTAAAPNHRQRMRGYAFAGAMALVLGWIAFDPLVTLRADRITAVGEIAHMKLSDGSTAIVDSNSALTVDFDGKERRIHLLRGEAWFQVAHDKAHPFIVDANGAQARAVGTAFSVRRGDDGKTDLFVTEGRVHFARGGEGGLEVVAGRAATLTSGDTRPKTIDASPSEELAWRSGRISFENRSLIDVAHMLERYRRGRIWVWGNIAQRRVSGVLQVGAIDEGLAGLAAAQRLRVTYVTPWLIILS